MTRSSSAQASPLRLWLRRLAWAIVILLVVAGAALAWLLTHFDSARVQGLLVDWVREHKQRDLVLSGPLKLKVLPRLELELSQVTLSEHAQTRQFASIDQAKLAVQVWPLLQGKLVVDRVSASGVQMRFIRDAQGRMNIDDLLSPNAPAEASGGASKPMSFEASGLDLSNLRVHVEDQVAKVVGDLTLDKLKTGPLADGRSTPVDLAVSANLSQPPVQASLQAQAQAGFKLDTGAWQLEGLKLSAAGDVPGLSKLKATVSGSASFDPAKLSYQAQDVVAQVSGLSSAAQIESSELRIAALQGPLQALQIKGIKLQAKGRSGARGFGLDLSTQATLDAQQLKATLSDLALKAQTQQSGQPELSLQTQGKLSFDGAATPRQAQWTLKGTVSGQTFSTEGHAKLTAAAPTLDVRANFDALDLNPFLPPASAAAASQPSTSTAELDNTPIDLSALRAVNGRFAVQAGQLAFQQFRFKQVVLNANLDGGVLRLDKLAAQAFGGQLQATGRADARGPSVAIKASGDKINILTVLQQAANKDLLEGTGALALDLRSSGASVGAMKSQLEGTANLQLVDGAIRGFNLAKALREAKAAFGSSTDTTQPASKQEKTDFSELSASFKIAKGVAHNDDLQAKSPYIRLTGAGDIDVGRSALNYLAKATVTAESQGQGGKELAQLSGLTIPVQLSGSFAAMQWKIKWSEVAAGMAKKTAKDKLQEQINKKLGLGGAAAPASAAEGQPVKKSDAMKNLLRGLIK